MLAYGGVDFYFFPSGTLMFFFDKKWNINVVTIAFQTFYAITTNYGLGLIGHFEMVKPIH